MIYFNYLNKNIIGCMGICQLSPEEQFIRQKNSELIQEIRSKLNELKNYGFSSFLLRQLQNLRPRYLFTTAIIQDINKLESNNKPFKEQSVFSDEDLDQQITNSCLILQNQSDLLQSKDSASPFDSFQQNMQQNQSLVAQINIIYSKDIKKEDYMQSLRLFLKWGQIFQQHCFSGFLSPLYQHFSQYICNLPRQDFDTIVDQICVFVQFMVGLTTDIYGLQRLATTQQGKLIKNENVYNLIMSIIFKRTKIKKWILSCIRVNDENKINLFDKQIERFKNKPPLFFQISKKFALEHSNQEESKEKVSSQKQYNQPYSQSLKLVNELCKNGAPITKLKTIVSISKQITKDIQNYYASLSKEPPQLDPDNLSSIIIYLLVKNGKKNIYEQLKIVQQFTTTNCLNCISGYYLNVFTASIQTILTLQEE